MMVSKRKMLSRSERCEGLKKGRCEQLIDRDRLE